MQAYASSLASGTTMLLKPDSDFFRYFRGPTGSLPDASAPAAQAQP
jgi:membrane protease subunit HflC